MKILIAFLSFTMLLGITSCNDDASNESEVAVKSNKVYPKLPENVLNQLQDGDIILRKGDGPLSFHLMRNSKEEYSHCGIIYKDNEKDKWMAIHTIGGEISNDEKDGVQTITLENFTALAADSTLYVCRPIFIDSAGTKVYERAKHYLKEEVPFDHAFNLLTTDKLYCSELLYHIFKDINGGKNIFDIKKKHKAYMLMFSTFFKENNFTKIYDMRKDS